jgi:hypothetical protein
MDQANPEADDIRSASNLRVAAEFEGKGGVTLWKKQGPTFSVIVFQLHDEPHHSWGLNREQYDMIELRVISARSTLRDFWKPTTKRLTQWKKSWILVCTDPRKSEAEFKKDVAGVKSYYLTFEQYEAEVEKAMENAQKEFERLSKMVARTPVGTEKPWAAALRNSMAVPDDERFWVVAVYPDGEFWHVKIHRGLLKSFGYLYPASWENGYVFESFQQADRFAKGKMKAQLDEGPGGYAPLTDPKTLRVLKWSLQHVEENP